MTRAYKANVTDIRNNFTTDVFTNHPEDDTALYFWMIGLGSQNCFRTRSLYPNNTDLILEQGRGVVRLNSLICLTTGNDLCQKFLAVC